MIENKNWNKSEAASIAAVELSRESWISKSYMASIFMGDFDTSLATPFPLQSPEDRKIGDTVCEKVETWCAENIDGEEIDRTGVIPAHVWKGLADMGLFAIKIPKKYNGLGLSQTNYMRILSVLSRHCASTVATISAHQSIGVPQPLKLAGTDAQKEKYLPRFREGWVSAFALTEPGVGSDPAKLSTEASLSDDGKKWILNGEKLWCTNGVVADILIVMAKTGVELRGKREINRITAFIVETRTPGVEVLHKCKFMGLSAIENALIRFRDVEVPVENVVGGEGQGLKIAFATLNDGRLGIPAVSAAGAEEIASFCARWAKSRMVMGKSVGAQEPGADKLARISSGAYAMTALSEYCAALSDGGKQDIRMEAAAAKMFNTEMLWEVADTALQLRGGRGYETATSLEERGEIPFPMERVLRDARINRIVEGTTDVMHLFLAREALDGHMQVVKPLFMKSSMGEKLKTLVKCAAFYPLWTAKQFVPSIFRSFPGFDGRLKGHLRGIDRRSKKLALRFFAKMALNGPGLADKQLTLARIVDIGTELAVMGLVASKIQNELNKGNASNLPRALYFLHAAEVRIDQHFRSMGSNSDKQARALSANLMEAAEPLPEMSIEHLQPIEREFGSDLTSGQIQERKEGDRKAPSGSAAAK
jgi:alkylation response protein AidB-like acyl-CoA dehydrogenase